MIIAGILCPLVPFVLMVIFSTLLAGGPLDVPDEVEIFAYFGWVPGLVALPLALALAHQANKRGMNGWLIAAICGAFLGALGGLVMDGELHLFFMAASTTLGTVYGLVFWALAHGLALYAERQQG